MANVTLEQLKEHTGVTDEQLGSVCSNEHLNKIADDIENYLQYAHALGLKDRQIAEIRTNVGLTFLLKTQKVLLMWKNDNIFTATYQRLVEAALLLGHGTLAGKICQLCKALSVETRTSLRANTDPNTEEADSGFTSPEHQALMENFNLLRSTIAQDPQGIGDKMLAKNVLARAQRDELRLRTTTNVNKARIIVDAIVDKTEGDEKYFKVFVQILKSTGSWTKDLVNSLVRSLDGFSRAKCVQVPSAISVPEPSYATVQPQNLDAVQMVKQSDRNKPRPPSNPTRHSRRLVTMAKARAPLTLADIQEKTGATNEHLNRICSDKHLKHIAKELDNYKQYGEILGLRDYQIAAIDTDRELNYLMKLEKVLDTWKKNNIHNATYGVLAQKSLDLSRSDIATMVCELSAESIKDEPEGVIPGTKGADKQYPESKPSTRSPGRSIMSYFGLLMLVFAILLACLGGYTFPSAQEQSPPSEEVNGAEVVPIVHPAQEQSTSFEEVNEDVPIVHPSTPPPSPAQEPSPPSEEVNEDVPIVHPSTPPPPPAQEPSPPSEEVNEDVPIVHPSTPPPSPAQELSFPSEEVNEVVPYVHPESAPKMIQLLHFKLKTSATINIAESIGTDYKIFGVCLLDDHNQVSNHEHGCHMKPVCTVVETLEDWLNGKGKMPVTWSTLVGCVEVSALSTLAGEITGQYSTSIEKK